MKRSPLINPELLERIIDASEDGIVVAEQEGEDQEWNKAEYCLPGWNHRRLSPLTFFESNNF